MKGSYILIIRVKNDLTIKIGSLGKTFFSKGVYAYVGSAMNSLEARIRRHLRNEKKTFWHIDYLLKNRNTEIIKIFYRESKNKEEAEKLREKKKSENDLDKKEKEKRDDKKDIKNIPSTQDQKKL